MALAADLRSEAAGGSLLMFRRPGDESARPAGWQSGSSYGTADQADDVIEKLERLNRLRQDGALTEAEFEAQKSKVIAED